MSKIQKLPQKVLDAITPYLLTGEVIDKALLQDNKKPKEIWLIKTNQAIILHGTQPDKPQPAIMVMALDEIREIDYLQKLDDIQIILYSSKNNGKAVFHFEKGAAKEIETFFLDLGDLITFRYQTDLGKIKVEQLALPIGHKDRKVFGRGKTPEVPFLSKTKSAKPSEPQPKSSTNTTVKTTPKVETTTASNKTDKKADSIKTISGEKVVKDSSTAKTSDSEQIKEAVTAKPLPEKADNKTVASQAAKSNTSAQVEEKSIGTDKKAEKSQEKPSSSTIKTSGITRNSLISHLQENPVPPKKENPDDEAKVSTMPEGAF